MQPSPFAYHDPRTVADSVDLLARLENAKVLAGGQSLIAMMALRYAQFDHLVDINRVAGLAGIEVGPEVIRFGAVTRQVRMMEHAALGEAAPIARNALAYVGHIPTRNRGTIGGSLCHLDPASELLALTALHDGVVVATSRRGDRRIAIDDFPAGYMTPAIEPDELATAVEWRRWPQPHGSAFLEFAQRHGDYAVVGVGCLVALRADERTVERAAVVLFGVGPAPVRLRAAELALAGGPADAAAFRAAAEQARQVDAMSDAMTSGAYRRRLAGVLTERALEAAASDALGILRSPAPVETMPVRRYAHA